MNEQVNKRSFSVSPHIIYSLIKAQAGTLGKGILECVMNSIDAGASKVELELTRTTLRVVDNGKGFQTRAEIEACFEVFGFEHKEGDRTYGAFGIGRAQLWNFCSTLWTTNQFRMDVDIKNRGLDYDLVESQTTMPGLVIEGKFYEPLNTSDIQATERELKELALYAQVPVTFNGVLLNKEPSKQKWTHETDDAWIALSSSSNTLTVYNLGVKVRDYPAYQFGCGGLVVTKPGVKLSLNMARNDILVAECKVWKRIRPFLQRKSDEAVKRTPRLTEQQLTNMAIRFLAGELQYGELCDRKLLVDVLGNKLTIESFLDKAHRTLDRTVTYAPREDVNPVSEQAHRFGHCFVLGHQSLMRFGVRSLDELMTKLMDTLREQVDERLFNRLFQKGRAERVPLKVAENWRDACKRVAQGYAEILHKEWTKKEQAAMAALGEVNSRLVRVLRAAGVTETPDLKERELRIGVSDLAHAWTDGQRVITFNRALLKSLEDGISGVTSVVNVFVHEYLHEDPSTDTHAHDVEFYERFHRVAVLHSHGNWPGSLGDLYAQVLKQYAKECARRGVAVKARVVSGMDATELYGVAA